VSIVNRGTVTGYSLGGMFFDSSADYDVTNSGAIHGREFGIYAFSSVDGNTIVSSGLIEGKSGITLAPSGSLATTIHDRPAGVIKGVESAITTGGGANIVLDNRGTIAGDIKCQAFDANDAVGNAGKIIGEVYLGYGNDTFLGQGGSSGKVLGEAGNDFLTGGSKDDGLDGGAGRDTLTGGLGKDQLFGGTERDIFDFNSVKESAVGAKRDVIGDFQRGNNLTGDDIDLRTIDAKTGGGNQAFKFIGTQAFHKVKGELHVKDFGAACLVQGDVNGDGRADFEVLVKAGALSAGDFLL
jgi:Ca2+-binding RTX toxin-like protein